MMDRISGAVMSLAVAVFGMVSPLSAQAENLARYSLDGGVTWTEAENIKKALQAVQGGTTAAIIETKGDSVMTGSSAHEQYCDVILRPWEGHTEKFRFYRSVSDPMMGRWVVKSGATLTISNIVVDAGAKKVLGLLVVESDATLHLNEGSEVVTSAETDAGAAIYNSGTVVFDGGVVHGWNVSGTLAPVIAKSENARFEINAGGIEDCSCDSSSIMSGTAICGDKITVVMTGGFIRNNHSSATNDDGDYHGAISCRLTSTVEISGGAITGNTGDGEHFCAVLAGQNGTVKISGNPVVRDNTTKSGAEINVFNGLGLGYWDSRGNDSPKLQLAGDLTSGADVGFYSQWNYAEDSTFGTLSAAGFTGEEYIHNDRNATLVGKADGTNLKWMVGGEGPVDPEEPLPVYTLTIPSQTGLELGADAVTTNDVPVAGVEGVYSIVSNTEVTINFKAASGYQIVSGNPVVVTVEADTVLDSAQYPIVEKRDIPTVTYGWKAEHLGTSETAIYTVGTKKYAYCSAQFGSLTVNTVPFDQQSDFPGGMSISVTGGQFSRSIDAISLPAGVDSNSAYGKLLTSGFWGPNSSGNTDVQITFNNLGSGKDYLVQFISHSTLSGRNGQISVGGKTIDPAWDFGGSLVGVFKAEGASQSFTFTFAGKSFVSGFQVRELAEGEGAGIIDDDPVPPEEPLPVYTLTIPSQTGLELGADAVTTNDVPVAGVEGVYSIVSNTEVTINFKAASGYQIVSGNPVVVTVEADMTLDQFPTVKKQGGEYELGWTAGPMAADGSTIRKDGKPVYAYCAANGTIEINGVTFAKGYGRLQTADVECSADSIWGNMLNAGLTGNMATLMQESWIWNVDGDTFDVTLTLKGLTLGKTYLCQLVSHSHWAPNMKISANGSPAHTIGDDTYGASIVGIFKATGETETVTVTYTNSSGDRPLNAIQVRELPVKKGVTILYL